MWAKSAWDRGGSNSSQAMELERLNGLRLSDRLSALVPAMLLGLRFPSAGYRGALVLCSSLCREPFELFCRVRRPSLPGPLREARSPALSYYSCE